MRFSLNVASVSDKDKHKGNFTYTIKDEYILYGCLLKIKCDKENVKNIFISKSCVCVCVLRSKDPTMTLILVVYFWILFFVV